MVSNINHKFSGNYGENDVVINFKEAYPVLLLNIEEYWNLKYSSMFHCDLLYIKKTNENNKEIYKLYVIELKTLSECKEINKEKILRKLSEKFSNTIKEIEKDILKFLNIRDKYKIVCVVITKNALQSHQTNILSEIRESIEKICKSNVIVNSSGFEI